MDIPFFFTGGVVLDDCMMMVMNGFLMGREEGGGCVWYGLLASRSASVASHSAWVEVRPGIGIGIGIGREGGM